MFYIQLNNHIIKTAILLVQVLTESKGGSLGSKMEVEEVGGEVAATDISAHSLAGAACGDMAEEKHTKWCETEVSD